jgi:8-oxo-dGTP diphosphatase
MGHQQLFPDKKASEFRGLFVFCVNLYLLRRFKSSLMYYVFMSLIGIAEIIIIHRGRVLLVQQRKSSVYGKWGFPGGHVEATESTEEALVREVKEELGIDIFGAGLQKIEHEEDGGDEGELIVSTYYLSRDLFLPKLQEEELIGSGWFTFDEFRKLSTSLRSPWMIEIFEQLSLLAQ